MSRRASIITLVAIVAVTTFLTYLGLHGMPLGRYDFLPFSKSISQGLDLQGGQYAVYAAQDPSESDLTNKITQSMAIMRNRLDSNGYTEATLQLQSGNRIRVEVPLKGTDVSDPDAVFNLIGKPAKLTFVDPDGKVVMTGDRITKASAVMSNGEWSVDFSLNSAGASEFAIATARLVGQPLAIVLDGKQVEAPKVDNAITGGSGTITGGFTQPEAQQLATQLQSGALPLQLKQLEASTLSATLGVDALRTGVEAGAIGLIAVVIFMIGFYRLPGFLADISLIVHTILLLYLLALLGVQLTLPGVAGIILGIGMSVDANVIIFARIREELVTGKTLRSAVDAGFKKAFITILDSNITNVLAGLVLIALGTGSVKGFAYTMVLGVVLSMFTAITLTRFLMNLMIKLNITVPWLYSHRWAKEEPVKGVAK